MAHTTPACRLRRPGTDPWPKLPTLTGPVADRRRPAPRHLGEEGATGKRQEPGKGRYAARVASGAPLASWGVRMAPIRR